MMMPPLSVPLILKCSKTPGHGHTRHERPQRPHSYQRRRRPVRMYTGCTNSVRTQQIKGGPFTRISSRSSSRCGPRRSRTFPRCRPSRDDATVDSTRSHSPYTRCAVIAIFASTTAGAPPAHRRSRFSRWPSHEPHGIAEDHKPPAPPTATACRGDVRLTGSPVANDQRASHH